MEHSQRPFNPPLLPFLGANEGLRNGQSQLHVPVWARKRLAAKAQVHVCPIAHSGTRKNYLLQSPHVMARTVAILLLCLSLLTRAGGVACAAECACSEKLEAVACTVVADSGEAGARRCTCPCSACAHPGSNPTECRCGEIPAAACGQMKPVSDASRRLLEVDPLLPFFWFYLQTTSDRDQVLSLDRVWAERVPPHLALVRSTVLIV